MRDPTRPTYSSNIDMCAAMMSTVVTSTSCRDDYMIGFSTCIRV